MGKDRFQFAIVAGAIFFGVLAPASSGTAAENDNLVLVLHGTEDFVRYESYGRFENVGTENYRYKILDKTGLSNAVGAGIFPNTVNLLRDPVFRKLSRTPFLNQPLDHYRADTNPKLAYYKWASLKGIPYQGLRMYNVAESLEAAGYPREALKAYYAIVVHFPKEVSWNNGRPWYVGVAALDSVLRLLDDHPEWNTALEGATITVENGFDSKATNDVVRVNPGTWVSADASVKESVNLGEIQQTRNTGPVQVVKRENGHWQILVQGKAYLIRGMAYSPTPIGRSPDVDGYKPHEDWMRVDEDEDGRADAPYQAWVDVNRNGIQEKNEGSVGDFELMSRMGVNAIRLYHHGQEKTLLRDLSGHYGIRVLMGDLLGAYTVGSGAEWEVGTDYTDPDQLEAMRESVREMVLTHKNEDYVLMWVLGNENNFGHGNNADKNPQAFYRFANEMARMIHDLDPDHPVALSNGDLDNLDLLAGECPDVDVLAVNAYRGSHGMGRSFWTNLSEKWGKPVLVAEFGCPAHNASKDHAAAEADQSAYLISSWSDIERHVAGGRIGNALGGVVFEWVDEWWKAGPEYDIRQHNTEPQTKGAFPGGFMYEEWLGVTSQGHGRSPLPARELRPAYFAFQKGPWKKPMNFPLHPSTVYGKK